jgi:hypothetical protein
VAFTAARHAKHPELSLADWLRDMRRAQGALPGEDVRIDVMPSSSIVILEQAVVVRGTRLPSELT